MSKKLNSWVKIETLSYLKVVSFGFLISVFVANCNTGDDKSKVVNKTDAVVTIPGLVTEAEILSVLSDTTKVNWLDGHGWDTIALTSNPEDKENIKEEMENIRFYVLGALAEYNAANKGRDDNIPYTVEDFKFAMKNKSPLKYTVIAFLNPPARRPHHDDGPGGHLIPPPPPPPGGR